METSQAKMWVARWKSAGNCVSTQATAIGMYPNLCTAQSAFFKWLSEQSVYEHLWHLDVTFGCFELVA